MSAGEGGSGGGRCARTLGRAVVVVGQSSRMRTTRHCARRTVGAGACRFGGDRRSPGVPLTGFVDRYLRGYYSPRISTQDQLRLIAYWVHTSLGGNVGIAACNVVVLPDAPCQTVSDEGLYGCMVCNGVWFIDGHFRAWPPLGWIYVSDDPTCQPDRTGVECYWSIRAPLE